MWFTGTDIRSEELSDYSAAQARRHTRDATDAYAVEEGPGEDALRVYLSFSLDDGDLAVKAAALIKECLLATMSNKRTV